MGQKIWMKRFMLLCLSLSVLTGCKKKPDISPSAQMSGPEFIAAFRQAHDGRDIEALSNLVCWDRVPPGRMRKRSEGIFRDTFDEKIVNVRLTTEHPQGRPTVYVRNGVTYGFNLPLVAEMVVENPSLPKEAFSGSYYPLGVKDGHYCIAQFAPADNAGTQKLSAFSSLPEQADQPSQTAKAAQPTVVPAKTVLIVRLVEDLGIKTAKSGGGFSATLVQPVAVNGVTVIPAGSPIQGLVAKKGDYSPDATLTSVTVNGTAHKISTGYMTFNEEIVFPAGSQIKFELIFPLNLNLVDRSN